MLFVLRFVENFIYLVSLMFIAERLLLLKRKKNLGKKWKWATAIWICMYMIFGIMEIEPLHSMISLWILTLLLLLVYYEGHPLQLLLYDLFAVLFLALLDEIAVLLYRLISAHFFGSLSFNHDSVITNLSAALLTILFLFLISNLFWKKYTGFIREVTLSQLGLMTVIAFLDVLTVVALFVITEEAGERLILTAMVLCMIVGLYLQLALLLPMIASVDIYRQKAELSQQYLNEQINHYRYLEEKDRELRKFRHDLKNQMAVQYTLYHEGKLREFEQLLEEFNDKITELGVGVNLNNGFAEAIVNRFQSDAKKYGIHLCVKGKLPDNCSLTGMEICTIISNLLSNALEAVRNCRGTEITLTIRYEGEKIYIKVENDCLPTLHFNGERVLTSKADQINHGLGLENVRECIEKHQGWINMEASAGRCITRIELLMKGSNDYENSSG